MQPYLGEACLYHSGKGSRKGGTKQPLAQMLSPGSPKNNLNTNIFKLACWNVCTLCPGINSKDSTTHKTAELRRTGETHIDICALSEIRQYL